MNIRFTHISICMPAGIVHNYRVLVNNSLSTVVCENSSVSFEINSNLKHMNKYLTLEEKQSLVNMLQKHYSIEEEPFISNLAEDDEEKVELTLKAFSLTGKPKNDTNQCIHPVSPYAAVQITKLSGKLQLVKAVNDITKWGLKEAKDFVDTIVSFKRIQATGIFEYAYKPFKIGPNERITVGQWKAIASAIPNDDIKWYYV